MPTLHDLILKGIENKYFQNALNPLIIVESPKTIRVEIGKGEATFPAWSPFDKEYYEIPLEDAIYYREISKEKFEKLKQSYSKTETNKHYINANPKEGINYGFVNDENNKANLSEKN